MNSRTIALVFALSLSLSAACAPVDGLDEAATQEADAVVLREGVTVDARYRFVYTTTPTYGSQPDAVLTVAVGMETNVGSLWAQSPDRNHPVRPADAR